MTTFKPFRGLRPDRANADLVCAPPYDVMSRDEAREMISGKPLSFLNASRPDAHFGNDVDSHGPEVYARGGEEFRKLCKDGALRRDERQNFYVYQLEQDGHSQTGIIGLASVEEYEKNIVARHELTRPDKVNDRAEHMLSLGAQTGVVFVTYRENASLQAIINQVTSQSPEFEFGLKDGSVHRSWTISDDGAIAAIQDHFKAMPSIYIADGHHRSECAAEVRRRLREEKGSGPWDDFLVIAFPEEQVRILGYHRIMRDLNGMDEAELLSRIGEFAVITDPAADSEPNQRGSLTMFIGGRWIGLTWKDSVVGAATNAVEKLDAALLQKHVLEGVFGIKNIRTDSRIDFVGGARGFDYLESKVKSGEFACAFALFPVSVPELMAVADEGGLMPPKSTWFDPKPLDAMAIHLLEG